MNVYTHTPTPRGQAKASIGVLLKQGETEAHRDKDHLHAVLGWSQCLHIDLDSETVYFTL